ncbi:helix-turn-helix transcriptional regulator [Actinocrispum sp. NPDC049592]|uniref:helix-turn-helix domain-containing protein n=1 Tax=Actinocrispum sp. NPDC049592 TaxID=3154835 RepID=UPI003438F413
MLKGNPCLDGGAHGITLGADSAARVVSSVALVPAIELVGTGDRSAVRLELDRDGFDLLRCAVDRMGVCLDTGALSGGVLMHATALAYPSDLPARVVAQRKRGGMSAAAFARRINVTAPTLSRVEHGSRRPSLRLLGLIAAALGVGLDELLAHDPGQEWVS